MKLRVTSAADVRSKQRNVIDVFIFTFIFYFFTQRLLLFMLKELKVLILTNAIIAESRSWGKKHGKRSSFFFFKSGIPHWSLLKGFTCQHLDPHFRSSSDVAMRTSVRHTGPWPRTLGEIAGTQTLRSREFEISWQLRMVLLRLGCDPATLNWQLVILSRRGPDKLLMYTSMLGVTSFGLVGHRRLPTISFYTNMFRLLSIDDLVSTFHLKIPVLNPKKKKKKNKSVVKALLCNQQEDARNFRGIGCLIGQCCNNPQNMC